MEYREAIEIFEETLTQVIVRMKKDGHTKKEIDQIVEAFNKVRNG
tara:strand:+ start:741 stop:875 length:135 start_codon:yes stop_codon:yes gene_type:complete